MSLTVIIGGVRSGKSAHAERLAAAGGRPVRYVATADASDDSMAQRIAAHHARRPSTWETVTADGDLAAIVLRDGCTLLDGLGVWLAAEPVDPLARIDELIAAAAGGEVIVVVEQAGEGMLPRDDVSRRWLDALGEATQRLSAAADAVDYVVAGRVVPLSAPPPAAQDDLRRPGDRDVRLGLRRPGDREVAAGLRRPGDRDVAGLGRPGDSDVPAGLRRHGDSDVAPGLRDHAVNVLEGGPPSWLRAVLRDAAEHAVDRYPDECSAVGALAAMHGRDPAQVVITNGAAEALWLLPAALRPRLAVCVHPGFTESEAALRVHRVPVARVVRDPEADFALDPGAIPPGADLVIVGNPASPSGTLDPASALAALRRPGRVVVVDEAFMSMVPGEPGSLTGEPLDDVIVVRSLTKLLALPGLRVGYALAAPPLAAALRAVRPPWSANAVALAAIDAAAAHPGELAAAAERSATEGHDLAARLQGLAGVRTWPSVTNFVLIEVADGPAVHRALRARGFAVRHAASFPGLGDGHLRLTARAPGDNAALVAALRETVA
ncbi:MAG: bifunctional adenosylcobinamide kinase/adenosylcobinamide-phosphate guanylyltransferase [Solirubrobacterales bacterium]|nr:bifunctional adenosylcobinamide kinase/adenosylcobinamide-phosphate guanylyltransferase [Solirubrobacterales bacterium]